MFDVARRLKKLVMVAIGQDLAATPELHCAQERFGSDYGGWNVAVSNLDADSIVYSFGVGEDASFDTALIEAFRLTVHAFDPTPRSIEWVRRQGFPDQFVMHEYGIAAFDGEVAFNPPENPCHVSHTLLARPSTEARPISVPVKKLGTIMKELGHRHIDVLKMDVEGAEYGVIDDIRKSTVRPEQVLVEFHHRFPGVGIKKTIEAVETLRSLGYRLYSVSNTNQEFCFCLGVPS